MSGIMWELYNLSMYNSTQFYTILHNSTQFYIISILMSEWL
jgi:hypothetical protein